MRVIAITAVAVSIAHALLTGQAKPEGPTVWDGVYTDAQAARAEVVFGQSCANCHTLAAEGNRPLSGPKFWEGYTQRTVGDLLEYIRKNMPNGSPGSLPAASYNDLAALILKSNGFPSGAAELTPETVANVRIIPKDGSAELPGGTLVRVIGCLAPRTGADWVLTNASVPERIQKAGAVPEDAGRPLGDRTMTLKFVLTRLDQFVGQKLVVTGLLIGPDGRDGINVTTVNRVAESCS